MILQVLPLSLSRSFFLHYAFHISLHLSLYLSLPLPTFASLAPVLSAISYATLHTSLPFAFFSDFPLPLIVPRLLPEIKQTTTLVEHVTLLHLALPSLLLTPCTLFFLSRALFPCKFLIVQPSPPFSSFPSPCALSLPPLPCFRPQIPTYVFVLFFQEFPPHLPFASPYIYYFIRSFLSSASLSTLGFSLPFVAQLSFLLALYLSLPSIRSQLYNSSFSPYIPPFLWQRALFCTFFLLSPTPTTRFSSALFHDSFALHPNSPVFLSLSMRHRNFTVGIRVFTPAGLLFAIRNAPQLRDSRQVSPVVRRNIFAAHCYRPLS